MNSDNTYYTDLIIRYLSGEAGEDEIRILSQWVNQSDENKETFEEYHKTWLEVEKFRIIKSIDTDNEWNSLKNKLNFEEKRKGISGKTLFLRISAIAAVLAIIFISSVLVFNMLNKSPKQLQLIAHNDITEGNLPDGSKISLYPGSQLDYPDYFDKKIRKVKLTGEACFEVTHNNKQPFVVDAGNNIRVEVIGTSFYINTSYSKNTILIILTSGQIAIYEADDLQSAIYPRPGERVEISKSDIAMNKTTNQDPNYMSWKSGKIVFNDNKLSEVVNVLNKVYRANIELSDSVIANCRITATFNNQTLNSVLTVLKETLPVEIKQSENKIEISGKGCE